MNVFLRATLAATLTTTSCLAQKGTVTFYTHAFSMKRGIKVYLPNSQQPFTGWILDGSQRLAHLSRGHFVIFDFNPGMHSITVDSYAEPLKAPFVINIKDGGRYCIRLLWKVTNRYAYARLDSQIEEVPCQQAQREAAHLKPVNIKGVDSAVRAELDPSQTFPGENQTQH